MKKLFSGVFVFMLCLSELVFAQKARSLPRSPLQQRYLINAVLMPQIKAGGFKITDIKQVDSIFHSWEDAWKSVAADSMAAHPTRLLREEFENLDAYCYIWGLASLTQNLEVGDQYASVISRYMAASLRKDLVMLKRLPLPEMIRGADLRNLFSIGSNPYADEEAFLTTYTLYNEYTGYFGQLANHADTNISKEAIRQLRFMDGYYYPMNARNSYYHGENDQALLYLITGLNVDRFSKTRAVDLSKRLLKEFKRSGERDKGIALLNELAVNTTADNLHRDTLSAWYAHLDSVAGPKAYENLLAKLSPSAFKILPDRVRLPGEWNFVLNGLPAEKIKGAKFILIDFWYTGCAPCLAEVPDLNAFYEKLKGRSDVVFVSVNTDYENGHNDSSYVAKRSRELKIAYPVFYDNETAGLNDKMNVTGYPHKVILTAGGELMGKVDGSGMTIASFETLLKELR